MSIDKEDADYPDSYWEYLDTIIDFRKNNPEPPMIKTIQLKTKEINTNEVFKYYKRAIQEHPPQKLSNGNWLHTYKLTPYQFGEDEDEEQEAFDREMYE